MVIVVFFTAVCANAETIRFNSQYKDKMKEKLSTYSGYNYTIDKSGSLVLVRMEGNHFSMEYYDGYMDSYSHSANYPTKEGYCEFTVFIPKNQESGIVYRVVRDNPGIIEYYYNEERRKHSTLEFSQSRDYVNIAKSARASGYDIETPEIFKFENGEVMYTYCSENSKRLGTKIEFEYTITCTDGFKKLYPDNWELIVQASSDIGRSKLTDSELERIPKGACAYTYTDYESSSNTENDIKKKMFRILIMTESEFASVADDWTYYKAVLTPVSDLSILNNGYTPAPSREHFLLGNEVSVPEKQKVEPQNIYTSTEPNLSFDTLQLKGIVSREQAESLLQQVVDGMSAQKNSP